MASAKTTIIPFLVVIISCVLIILCGIPIAEPDEEVTEKNSHWKDMIDDLNEYGGRVCFLTYLSGSATSYYKILHKGDVVDVGDGILMEGYYFVPYKYILTIVVYTPQNH